MILTSITSQEDKNKLNKKNGVSISPRQLSSTVAISSNTLTIDCNETSSVRVALTSNISTIELLNVPEINNCFVLHISLVADGTARTVTWPATVKWPDATAPTLTSTNGKIDTFVFMTYNGGTSWLGFIAGQNQ